MEDVKVAELGYRDLQRECARRGLGGAGTKDALSERLDRHQRGDQTEKVMHAETDNKELSAEKVPEQEPTSQTLMEDEVIPNHRFDKDRWLRLSVKLDTILKGRVSYSYDPIDHGINFNGTARQAEWVTMTAPDKTIEKIARRFTAPTIVPPSHGKNWIGIGLENIIR